MGYYFYNPSENKVFVARNAEFFENGLIDLKSSGSVEDLELIPEEDTNTSLDTNQLCLYIDTEEYELGDLGEPANNKAAFLDPESKKWLDAMNVEMQSMKGNDVWVLVELPPNARTVSSKWLFKKKTDMDDIRAIRILIAIAVFYDYEIWQMDVKTAFLNGHLSEEVYMTQPKDAEYIAAFDASKELIWIIRKFIFWLGARHFCAKVYYLRETIKLGDVKIEKVDTDDNLADPFIKALEFPKHSDLTRNIVNVGNQVVFHVTSVF
ncbi:retrotransposon protein, putative, ty1-copia subclass [Tanacetum coccineum]